MPSSSPSGEAPQAFTELLAEFKRLRRELDIRDCALDAATTHFMVLDAARADWPIIYVNRALCRDHGYEPEELLNQSAATKLVDVESSGPQLAQINEAIQFGQMIRTELQARRKNGTKFWVGLTVGPVLNDEGVITHYIAVGADITLRREENIAKQRLQAQLLAEMQERERISIELRLAQKLESVGRLAAGIAHEINTPIQYVGDSIHFLRTAVEDYQVLLTTYREAIGQMAAGAAAPDIVERIARAESKADLEFLQAEVPKAFERTLEGAERVASIVRAMKEFAHPDASEQRPADINHALQSTLMVARNEYKYCAAIELNLQELPDVTCNIGELNQVFLNLIVNASDAIRDTGRDASTGKIEIATALDGECVSIRIADNGCGIPSENLEKIFDPFFTTKEVGKGTGQGLAITRSIIERHGGKVSVQSTIGAGTRFEITLPVAGRQPVERAA